MVRFLWLGHPVEDLLDILAVRGERAGFRLDLGQNVLLTVPPRFVYFLANYQFCCGGSDEAIFR